MADLQCSLLVVEGMGHRVDGSVIEISDDTILISFDSSRAESIKYVRNVVVVVVLAILFFVVAIVIITVAVVV